MINVWQPFELKPQAVLNKSPKELQEPGRGSRNLCELCGEVIASFCISIDTDDKKHLCKIIKVIED